MVKGRGEEGRRKGVPRGGHTSASGDTDTDV